MSQVIELQEIQPSIIKITMQDRKHKNMFTDELYEGLYRAFRFIEKSERYKVVILTGYDNYFSSGGTQTALLAIHEGKAQFTDFNIYNLTLNCNIPVIAAMQGHAIGGGLVMGLFADFVIMSRESVYSANFMRYGFTPGMGATYIVPKKLGTALAGEMLLNGSNYRGGDLMKRGIPYPVLPRTEVMAHAIQLSREIAEKPRKSLMLLKDHLVSTIRNELPIYIEKEIMLHKETFHQEDVKNRIIDLFGK